ncbi:MAG: SurA N-terminal domain-containing protein [Minisyncoccia bacterium]
MDSTQEKEQTVVGVLPETVIPTEEAASVMLLEAPLPWYKNTKVLIAMGIALVLLVGASFYAYTMYTTGGTVAVVNGTKITQKEFNENVALIEKDATLQGADITNEATKKEIQTQALETLINNTLLLTAADSAGFSVSDEDIQAKYDELATQLGGAETLAAKMVEVGLTEEKLRSNIAERILSDLYIESVTTIEELTVSDVEVAEFYKTINTGESKIPPLGEIQAQIKDQILGQKRQQLVTDLLAKLRAEGDVVIKI